MPALAPLPSPARTAANRANAQRSTGARTEAGKARSRANALKHGLAGAGIGLPSEDPASNRATLRSDVNPPPITFAERPANSSW